MAMADADHNEPGRVTEPEHVVKSEPAAVGEARGTIILDTPECTSCMLCVRECPVWCIELTSHTEQVDEPGARRPRSVAVLDTFTIDWGLCMFCGICVEVCPFDALAWSPALHPSSGTKSDLVTGIDVLSIDR
jgi:NADH-quinone oxidoreductase subunit I